MNAHRGKIKESNKIVYKENIKLFQKDIIFLFVGILAHILPLPDAVSFDDGL